VSRPAPLLTIFCDTREQCPPPFPPGVDVERRTLAEGDYSTPALLDYARIERKSLPDLIASPTFERERFLAEIERLRRFRFRCVVVEGDMGDIVQQRYRSQVLPQSIVGSCSSLFAGHGCPVLFAHNPVTAGYVIAGLLRRLEDERAKRATEPQEAEI
jgi:ERCC4-type nuclease